MTSHLGSLPTLTLAGTGWEPQNSLSHTSLREEILQSWEYLERVQQIWG